jgi:hypothetical protein
MLNLDEREKGVRKKIRHTCFGVQSNDVGESAVGSPDDINQRERGRSGYRSEETVFPHLSEEGIKQSKKK